MKYILIFFSIILDQCTWGLINELIGILFVRILYLCTLFRCLFGVKDHIYLILSFSSARIIRQEHIHNLFGIILHFESIVKSYHRFSIFMRARAILKHFLLLFFGSSTSILIGYCELFWIWTPIGKWSRHLRTFRVRVWIF